MEYAIGYVAVVFVLQALAAIRTPHQDCQAVIVGSVFWPLVLILVVADLILDAIGWEFDLQRGKMFGFRRPTVGTGFAVSVFYFEFQFWKNRG